MTAGREKELDPVVDSPSRGARGLGGSLKYYLSLRLLGGRIKSYIAPPSLINPSFLNYIRQFPLVFGTWVQLRRIRFLAIGKLRRRIRLTNPLDNSHATDYVLPYNKRRWWHIQRERTERLMSIFRSIRGLDIKNSKVLCIGPRNEAEILLLSTYGFGLKNIKAIDLFSYSPLVDVMDMHELRFDDNQFDIVYSAFVLRYSNDIQRACSEAVRVSREDGLMAITFEIIPTDVPRIGTALHGGLAELFGYFEGHIKHIYWQEETHSGTEGTISSTVFSISK